MGTSGSTTNALILNAAELNELRGVPLRLQKPSNRRNLFSEEDEDLDLSSFASKKAASAGALGTGLLSSNADQLKTVLLKDQKNYFHYTKIGLLGFSIFLQVVVMSLMIYMGSNGQVKSHKRKK